MRAIFPPTLRLAALALVAALAASCAAPPPPAGPGAPPADFLLEVRSRGATNPHCDYDVTVDSAGRVTYVIDHHGRQVGDRRGEERIAPDDLRELWRAADRSGLLTLPPSLPPQPGQDERGEVRWRLRAGGKQAEVVADRSSTPGLDGLLREVHRAVPWRAWQVPGEEP